MSFQDPYRSQDVFADARGHRRRIPQPAREVTAKNGVVIEASYDGFVGAIIGLEKTSNDQCVRLEDRHSKSRLFPIHGCGFLIDGKPVALIRPKTQPKRLLQDLSASGSRKVHNAKAEVVLPSRIWVEGIHDAAIVKKVWGHDLRVEGVVTRYLEDLDNLSERLAEFDPGPKCHVGVLADHLVGGSKGSRMTQQLGPHVMVTGHPLADVQQVVKPSPVDIEVWPEVPYGEDWKAGICRRLGWGDDPKQGWRRVYAGVHTYRDLESDLIGAVERLVDFVIKPHMQYWPLNIVSAHPTFVLQGRQGEGVIPLLQLGASLLLVLGEFAVGDLALLILGGGTLAISGVSQLGAPLWLSVVIFAAVSATLMLTVRPVLRKKMAKSDRSAELESRPELLADRHAEVIEPVPSSLGLIEVDGELWSTRSLLAAQTLGAKERVTTVETSGSTAVVDKLL